MEVIMQLKLTILAITAIFSATPATAMLGRLQKAYGTRLLATSALRTVAVQKRLLYSPCQLKGLSALFPVDKQHLSPVFGTSLAHSPYLRNLYAHGNAASPLVRLLNDPKIGLFHKQGDQFRPTHLKSNPAYSLTPTILGHIIGAIETKKIHEKKTQESLIEIWRAEHKKLCNGYANNIEKHADFLNLLCAGVKANEQHARTLLLGFLNCKAYTKQDMTDYRTALGKYIPMSNSKISAEFLTDTFSPADRVAKITAVDLASKTLSAAIDFEKTVFTLAERQTLHVPYPPQVIQGHASFKGQSMVANCVEAAFMDTYNILLYNHADQKFDVSLLPAHISPKPEFKKFYETICTLKTINDPCVSHAFMDMVSGIKGVDYSYNQNYELDITSENFLHLTNHLLNIDAKDYQELGHILSDSRRAVTFTPTNEGTNSTIAIEIIDNHTKDIKYAKLVLKIGLGDLEQDHGGLEVPARINSLENDPSSYTLWQNLAKNDNLNAQTKAQSLAPFVAPPQLKFLTEYIQDPQVLHNALYSLPLNDPWDLQVIIARLINLYLDKPVWKTIEEDCQSLLTRLDSFADNARIKDMLSKIIASKAHANSSILLNYCLKHSQDALLICVRLENAPLLQILLENGASCDAKTKDHKIVLLYAATGDNPEILTLLLKHGIGKEKVYDEFSPIYLAINRNKPENLKLLLAHGADCNAPSINGETPLQRAIRSSNEQCIKLLLAHGADYKTKDKYGVSGLSIALEQKQATGRSIALELIHEHEVAHEHLKKHAL